MPKMLLSSGKTRAKTRLSQSDVHKFLFIMIPCCWANSTGKYTILAVFFCSQIRPLNTEHAAVCSVYVRIWL